MQDYYFSEKEKRKFEEKVRFQMNLSIDLFRHSLKLAYHNPAADFKRLIAVSIISCVPLPSATYFMTIFSECNSVF